MLPVDSGHGRCPAGLEAAAATHVPAVSITADAKHGDPQKNTRGGFSADTDAQKHGADGGCSARLGAGAPAVLLFIAASIAIRAAVSSRGVLAAVGSRGSLAAVLAAPAAATTTSVADVLPTDGTFAGGTSSNGTTATWQETFARSVEAHPALKSRRWLLDSTRPLHQIRQKQLDSGISWPENRRVVTSAGLPWCNTPKVVSLT